ncbi:hypothetical protein DOV67_27890 [Salmonella enterica subsp. enterica serovar Java]|uniref:Uncharacterized protein n=3 Tax=Salmonella enterica TaxID=28901 RepID=A0A3R0U630_SALER|nr:hypothetical protein [Salmonella enterica subsp. enterica serovar Java]EBR8575268.1 hypothetical protein [Salmonella enterica subsp. enterica serovar Java]ECS8432558.1 hypothetical protein [Salmonella enterica]MLE32659.1 hypothetical protein [Salmonella enterica]
MGDAGNLDLSAASNYWRCHISDYFPAETLYWMVRKMNHRFKNFITMNVAVGSAVTAGHLVTYDEKMRVSAHF